MIPNMFTQKRTRWIISTIADCLKIAENTVEVLDLKIGLTSKHREKQPNA